MDDNQQTNPVSGGDGPQDGAAPILPAVDSDVQGKAGAASVDDDQTVPTSRALVTTPEEASDSDLIEKEWVIKAKQIVEHTAEDPFQQQQELAKMKADYMKKRYNKDLGSAQ